MSIRLLQFRSFQLKRFYCTPTTSQFIYAWSYFFEFVIFYCTWLTCINDSIDWLQYISYITPVRLFHQCAPKMNFKSAIVSVNRLSPRRANVPVSVSRVSSPGYIIFSGTVQELFRVRVAIVKHCH